MQKWQNFSNISPYQAVKRVTWRDQWGDYRDTAVMVSVFYRSRYELGQSEHLSTSFSITMASSDRDLLQSLPLGLPYFLCTLLLYATQEYHGNQRSKISYPVSGWFSIGVFDNLTGKSIVRFLRKAWSAGVWLTFADISSVLCRNLILKSNLPSGIVLPGRSRKLFYAIIQTPPGAYTRADNIEVAQRLQKICEETDGVRKSVSSIASVYLRFRQKSSGIKCPVLVLKIFKPLVRAGALW